jgi:hypothetical protein
MYVYRGCKPRCHRIGGPFPLRAQDAYGHIDRNGTLFAAGGDKEIDVFSYSPTSVKYLYSFDNGIPGTNGVAFSPRT